MGKGPKSLAANLVKPSPERPAEYVPAPAVDPAAIAEKLNLWRLNEQDRYYQLRPDSELVTCRDRTDLARFFRVQGISDKQMPGRTFSDTDAILEHIQEQRCVEFAGPVCGKKVGVHESKGRRLLVTSSPRLVEPKAGNWSRLQRILEGMLCVPEADQLPWYLSWQKVGYDALCKGKRRPGHFLVLAGPHDSGKSFLQNHVVTPLLGGRVPADPTRYITSKTTFNAELFSSEHLAIEELPSGLDFQSRSMLAEELKRLIATETHALHRKHRDAIAIEPWWRVTLSINDNLDKLRALPPLSADFGDKVLLLRCQSIPENFPGPDPDEREAFLQEIYSELPAFAASLNDWEIPPELRQTEHAARFGMDYFHNPRLTSQILEQEPEGEFLEILDSGRDLYNAPLVNDDRDLQGLAWGWKKSEQLKKELCELSSAAGDDAREFFASKKGSYQNACGQLLSKLMNRFPERVQYRHHRVRGNSWFIHAPAE